MKTMNKVCKIISIGEPRKVTYTKSDGSEGEFEKLDIRLADGTDEFIAETSEFVTKKLKENPLPVGTLVGVDVVLGVRKGKEEGRFFNSITLRNYRVM